MVLAHLPSGYVLSYINEKLFGLETRTKKSSRRLLLAVLTMIGSVFPDIDTIPFFLGLEPLQDHRKYITHTLFPYLLLLIILYFLFKKLSARKKRTAYRYSFAFFSGILLHLVTDSLIFGVRWLYPLNNSYIALFNDPNIKIFTGNNLVDYMFSWYFLLEFFFIITAFVLYFDREYLRK